jgi:hypothetical protein
MLSPSLYCYYDFGRKEIAMEGKITHTFDLSQSLIHGVTLECGAKAGYDHMSRLWGRPYDSSYGKKSYCYYGANADLVYGLGEHVKAKVGVAYEGNSAKKVHVLNVEGKKNSIWFNASVDCSF